MRLIDADALKEVIHSKSDGMEDLWDTAGVLNAINNSPTVAYSFEDGLKKSRLGNYVIYDVDFLLDNLAREVHIMEGVRQWKADGIIRDCGEENE